jgi:hypothetical protein
MKQALFSLLIFCFFIASKTSAQTNFEKDGIKLTCPSGWKITEEEDLNGAGYYLAIEKNGLNSSGTFILVWINDTQEPKDFLESYKDQLKSNPDLDEANLIFSTESIKAFNGIRAISMSYSLALFEVKHKGIIYAFNANKKTICLVKQEALEDEADNRVGFNIIEKSFSAK